MVQAHGELYAREYGWDTTFEELVAGIVGEYAAHRDPARERGWIAEVDGERAGCVFCTAGPDPDTAKLRILLVDPKHRGLGLGARLVDTCLDFARAAGYRRMTLWTNSVLISAATHLRGGGFPARRRGAAPQLRARPDRPDLGGGAASRVRRPATEGARCVTS